MKLAQLFEAKALKVAFVDEQDFDEYGDGGGKSEMTVYTVQDVGAFNSLFDNIDSPTGDEVQMAREMLERGQIRATSTPTMIKFKMDDEGATPMNKGILYLYPEL